MTSTPRQPIRRKAAPVRKPSVQPEPSPRKAVPCIVGMSTDEIVEMLVGMGEPAFRGRQVAEWVYRRSARSFEEMANVPKALREKLAAVVSVGCSTVEDTASAPDGTIKLLLRQRDGECIETVLLPYEDHTSACLSTQAGCAIGCRFCASGMHGLRRSLTAGEIVDQVLALQAATGTKIDHIVFMGVGEPLMNYVATIAAVRLITGELGIGQRRITISTVGLPVAIKKLAAEGLQVGLALSLHASDQRLREDLVPAAKKYPIEEILEAVKAFVTETGRKATIEYVLLGGVNDQATDARRLAGILRGLHCTVNLIPYNPVEPDPGFVPPEREAITQFRAILEAAGFTVTQRYKRGLGINAACGQLRAKALEGEPPAKTRRRIPAPRPGGRGRTP